MEAQIIAAGGALKKKREEAMTWFKQFETVGDQQAKEMTGEDVVKFKAFEQEITDLQKSYDDLLAVERAKDGLFTLGDEAKGRTPAMGRGREAKTVGKIVVEKGIRNLRSEDTELEADAKSWLGLSGKATMTTTANGYPPESRRDGDVVGAVYRPPQLLQFLTIEPTSQNAIVYMAQTVRTSAAAEQAEAAAMNEATLTWEEQTDSIRRIGHYIPVTEEELEDEAGLESMVNMELADMVYERLDAQVYGGDGNAPNIKGILNDANIQTQAKGADPTLDAIAKAILKVDVTARAAANLVVMHATDHTNLMLTRTADGLYILGNPADGMISRVWGLPIARNESQNAGTGCVLDTRFFRVKMRKGVTVAYSDSHSDNFVKNVRVIKAYCRAGLKRRRGAAACKFTGL
jgi:HK97 family phage major capsid protein